MLKNAFYFTLSNIKNSHHSQDIEIFVFSLWACRKKGLNRKISLISKFMTSQAG